ncbi:MAG: FumA C-terminus/TtdB family hydratase beta subunit [Candidatus Hermodarchaeota archaeon]|nr:FumA C-terminus/TtdB family hydratase beta subunit [Candidatus Hermodarchaeota archaeon]
MATYELETPISEEDIRKLRVNDIVFISGTVFTARDEAHERALKWFESNKPLPIQPNGLAVFHCGPIVRKKDEQWELVAAGPTTSTRMEMFEDKFLEAFQVRVVIGKGGMGAKTAAAMKKVGAVYGAFTGGAAVLAANTVRRIKDVAWLDLGMPEAMWIMEVEHFGPLIVAIDATGENLFERVKENVERSRQKVYQLVGLQDS